EVPLDEGLDAVRLDAHCGGHHLAGELRARGERPKQEVAGTGAGARSAHARMGLGLVEHPADVDRARHGAVVGIAAAGRESYLRLLGVEAVRVLDGLLCCAEIHLASMADSPDTWPRLAVLAHVGAAAGSAHLLHRGAAAHARLALAQVDQEAVLEG